MKRMRKGGVAGDGFFCALESRRHFSVTVSLSGAPGTADTPPALDAAGMFHVDGNSSDNTFVIRKLAADSDTIVVDVSATFSLNVPGGAKGIILAGGDGNDRITDQLDTPLPLKIYG